MHTQSAIRLGIDLSLASGRDLFDLVVQRRSYISSMVPVPKQHEQALALLCKHAPVVRERSYLMAAAWFTDWSSANDRKGDGPSCWIAPKGMIYPIEHANHSYFASLAGLDGCTSPLERAGWLHVSGGRIDVMFEPTSLQRKALDKIKAWGGRHELKEVSRDHQRELGNVKLNRLDRVPRDNFEPDANFWADEHSNKEQEA